MSNSYRRQQEQRQKRERPTQMRVNFSESEEAALRDAEQAELNRDAQRQQQNLNQQLANLANQQGAGRMAYVSPSSMQQIYQEFMQQRRSPIRPNTPMNVLEAPKYLVGYKVTIRTGKTIFTVDHFEERRDEYSGQNQRYYYLVDASGRQSRELEQDLRLHEEKIKAKVDFDTVIIADEKRDQILEALEQINQSDLIFDKWGFGETIEKGKGVSLLFYGPPGTGKTLMAQAIANRLDKTLRVISTADIESSAPGEAERNIRKHFKEASDGKSILLFDECDSLIYSRANTGPILSAQINELLSQIERFDGITLFTTNRLGTLDEAVNRRLALKLEFEMPSPAERAKIWQRMFPAKAPLDDDIDWNKLAGVEITGGYIKNAVLRAARMAAIEKLPDDQKKISMKHLKRALKLEAESMMEFEKAREENERGIGHSHHGVVRAANGQIQKVQESTTVERKVEMVESEIKEADAVA